jgi:hypothetical protein
MPVPDKVARKDQSTASISDAISDADNRFSSNKKCHINSKLMQEGS